ncbi:uncharacterized protein At4g10930 isoform X2 [Cornus florida]|uniref:uncharacterized protein At4g10930 isoform X2 n=1 Tax=Cornus florida TaxID=4283 RepID=UPI0028A1DD74|nr:uncharacterized protein At4g10930 isoform X2 [Cornus florida]
MLKNRLDSFHFSSTCGEFPTNGTKRDPLSHNSFMDIMDVDFFTEGVLEEDIFEADVNNDDYSTLEGERCGICMDVVIDRGLLDCCQHWFCFTCIDNWATITNLCPLCQNEFQLITCVPVYDTIGSNKVDEDLLSRDDDWCVEGMNNTLSFPSYYIDENAVICLDGDGCKIRSGSATIGEDPNLDTSIACDSCDMWYHAFCVGFDPEGTCENSWLCPRCIANENTQKSDVTPIVRPSNQCGLQNAISECLVEAAFSGKVSVSVADAGETAVVVSMVEDNQGTEGSGEKKLSTIEVNEDLNVETLKSSSSTSTSNLETPSSEKTSIQLNSEAQELKPSSSRDTSFILPSISLGLGELKTDSADKAINISNGFNGVGISSTTLFDEPCQSSVDLNLGLSVGFSLPVDNIDVDEDQVAGDMLQKSISEECLLPVTGAKRKRGNCSDDVCPAAEDAETKAKTELKALKKKSRAEGNGQIIHLKDQADGPVSDESQKCWSLIAASRDEKLIRKSEKKNVTSDIMSIVQGTDRRPLKGLASPSPADKSSKERESAAGLRVKKILRRATEDKESSMLVQELRKEIREAVRNKSSREFGENDFDPKLLAAFRAAVAGPITEQSKKLPPMVVKAKKSLLQKGKIRENLTKKIYGIGGRRRRAWTRDCEIEFWKYRCLKITKPEKIATLKSVLNLLRKSSEGAEIKQGIEGEATNSILSRLYLADNSVFPRKDDIKPLSALKATRHPQENKEHFLTEKASTPSLGNNTVKTLQMNKVSSQVGVLSSDNKRNKIANVPSIKGEAASSKVHPNKCPEGPSVSSLGGSEGNSQKEVIGKSDDVKSDKRKWALEVLKRKTAVTGSNASQEKEEDNAVLKGNYPLLAQLPVDMRPALAPSRHNKIAISVRQAQLYRLTEHLLRKANLPVIRRTAATEFAVADAVNIEKEVADRSNSKLVYMNLCSQELYRSDNTKSRIATESNSSSNEAVPAGTLEQATNDLSPVPVVEEALRNAGLLSDSPPNSPHHQMEEIIDEDDPSRKFSEEGPNDVFEMDPHPDLDIYGDFEYNLEDEDFVGASALKVSNLKTEGESQIKVVFSTLNSDRSNNDLDLEKKTISEVAKGGSCSSECNTDASISTTTADGCLPQDSLLDEGGEEPSLALCDELYGPDKEPLIKRFPEMASMKPCELKTDDMVPENSLGCPQTSENGPKKEISNTDIKKQADNCNSVSKKVEAYIKEHIRPLCKSGVITVEQYRWAVGKTTDKVMKYHSKEKNANFLVKEGEKVKKLAEQYVETAQKDEK